MRPHTIALATVAMLGLAGAAPAAAADWTAPQTISSPHTSAWIDRPSFTTNGATVASWGWQDGLGNGSTVGASMATWAPPQIGFAAQRPLPQGTVGGAHAYGSSRLLVATQTGDEADATLRVRFGTLDGRFGRAHRIARMRGLRGAQLAVNPRGDAVLGWWVDDGVARDRVYVSLRRRGGGFGAPVRLATGRLRSVSVAIGARGDVLAAWDALGVVRTRLRKHTDRGFRRVDELRSEDAYSAALRTAISPSGRAWVAWTAQMLSEGGDRGEVFVQAATRSPGARRFGRALLLQRAPSWALPSPVSLSVGATGEAVLGWALWSGGPSYQPGFTDIHAARVSAAGVPTISTLAHFQSVELRDSAVAAAADAGGATILWTRSTEPATDAGRLLASVRTPTGDWGDPELVFEGRGLSGSVAYPAGAGTPLVVFADRLADPPLRRVVRATIRR